MMVNIRTRVPTLNMAFPSWRNVALTVRKKLQYTTLAMKIHHCTIKIPEFLQYQTTLLVSQYIARIRNNTQTHSVYNRTNLFIIRCKHVLTQQMSICKRTIRAEASKSIFFVVCMTFNVHFIFCFCYQLYYLTNFSSLN